MKLEKLEDNTSKVKGVIIGILLTIGLVILINNITSLARYRNTESIELASGNISYNKADLNIIAMYQESSYGTNGYKQIDDVPTEKYTLSNKSYCEVNKEAIEDAQIEYREGAIYVGNIKKRGTKCYIYFDLDYKAEDMLAKLEALKGSKYTIDTMPSPITGPYDENTENPEHKEKLYTTEDNYGTSYVFRGNNNDVNNWVTFANHTWRIIRINGDGTLRMIYQCNNPGCTDTEGNNTQLSWGIPYKSAPVDDNTYAGYYYGEPNQEEGEEGFKETHSNKYPNDIVKVIKDWYTTGRGKMTEYTKYLSGDTGFCNDRVVVNVSDYGKGTGKSRTRYGPSNRINNISDYKTEQYPTLKCGANITSPEIEYLTNFEIDENALKRDLYTLKGSSQGNGVLDIPAATITSDEALMAGGFGGTASTNYWLYVKGNYWTMSPGGYDINNNWATIFRISEDGKIAGGSAKDTWVSTRPVINLNADVEFTQGNGTSTNPFIVNTDI